MITEQGAFDCLDLIRVLDSLLVPQIANMTIRELSEFIWCAARLYHKKGLKLAQDQFFGMFLANTESGEEKNLQPDQFAILCKVLWSLSILGEINYEVCTVNIVHLIFCVYDHIIFIFTRNIQKWMRV